jgi:glycosyltransferase involved in cell wall biosynthesis
VGWRQSHPKAAIASGLGDNCGQRWLWLHDAIVPEYLSGEWTDKIDLVFCLTEFHAKKLPEAMRDRLVLTKNGINRDYLVDGQNAPTELIYASSPDRGMDYVLREWPKIRVEFPEARLHLYYGFTQNWMKSEAHHVGLRRIRSEVMRLKDQPGVVWHGMVGQKELSQAFADCGFWLYPTEWPETSCITAMKAQAMGCIPITSRFPDSGVPETTKYDLGPPPRHGSLYANADWLAEWTASVIASVPRQDLGPMREQMKSWAREVYSWAKVAAQWNGLFTHRSSGASASPLTPAAAGSAT